MSAVYEAIGRIYIGYIRIRYRRKLRVAALVAVAATIVAGYRLAGREVEEG